MSKLRFRFTVLKMFDLIKNVKYVHKNYAFKVHLNKTYCGPLWAYIYLPLNDWPMGYHIHWLRMCVNLPVSSLDQGMWQSHNPYRIFHLWKLLNLKKKLANLRTSLINEYGSPLANRSEGDIYRLIMVHSKFCLNEL